MDNILQLTGINDCFIYIDTDYIYAVAEMDEEDVTDNKAVIKIPAHTRIFTERGDFRVKDKVLDVMSKIEKINNRF